MDTRGVQNAQLQGPFSAGNSDLIEQFPWAEAVEGYGLSGKSGLSRYF